MKIKEIRDQTSDALQKRERDLYDQLFKLRFQMATNQNENPGRIRLAKKELARVKTIIRERQIEASKKDSAPAAAGTARSVVVANELAGKE